MNSSRLSGTSVGETKQAVTIINNMDALNSMLGMGMKLESPSFDMKSLIRLDLQVDLSMIQTAVAYLFKTSALHDKEIVELR